MVKPVAGDVLSNVLSWLQKAVERAPKDVNDLSLSVRQTDTTWEVVASLSLRKEVPGEGA